MEQKGQVKEKHGNKELAKVKLKIQRLREKKAFIDRELEPLLTLEEELENREIIAVCRKHNITIVELMKRYKEREEQHEDK